MRDYERLIFGNLGECGLFQFFVFIACNLADTPAAWAMTLMSFAGASPDWWSVQKVQNSTGSHGNFTSNVTHLMSRNNETQVIRKYKICPTGPEEKIYFSDSIVTIVSEWELVCERDWIPTTITTIQMAGVLVGAFIIGQLADIIGRKKSFFGIFFLMMLFTCVSAFSTSWQMFAALRFLIGLTLGGFLVVSYTLPIEYIGAKWRTIGGSCPAWALGVSLLGLASWVFDDWRKLSLLTTGIGAPLLLTWWFVPESCRWLLSKGRIEEAEVILKRMAKLNKKPPPDLSSLKSIMSVEQEKANKQHTYSLLDLFTHGDLRKHLLIFGFMFFSVVLGYYGFTLGVTKLSGNRHLNLFLSGFVEALAVMSVVVLSVRLRRRNTTMLLYILAGVCSLSITGSFYAADTALFKKLETIFSLGAKFFLSAAFVSLFLAMAETFPTVVRNLGFGTVSTAGRFGGLLAPQIVYMYKVSVAIPYVVCGSLLTVSGLLCLLLKDTYQCPLPDEIEITESKRDINLVKVQDNVEIADSGNAFDKDKAGGQTA